MAKGTNMRLDSSSRSDRKIASRLFCLMAVACALLLAQAVPAETLVLVDGSKLEIRGPVKEQGKNAVFYLPNGTLSMLPLDEIDAAATAVANAPRPAVEPAAAAAPKHSGLVLNNENVRRAEPAAVPATAPVTDGAEAAATHGEPSQEVSAAGAPPASEAQANAPGPPQLNVTSWNDRTTADSEGATFSGRINNPSNRPVGGITLAVHLVDADGQRLSSTSATLSSNALGAGQSATFNAVFPGDFSYQTLDFEAQSSGFSFGPGGRAQIDREDGLEL